MSQPTSEDLAIWQQGARKVREARKEFGLSRNELFSLMANGTLHWCVKDRAGTRLIAYSDSVRYVASLYAAQK